MTVGPIEAGADALQDELVDVATTVLPYAAILAGITVGWRWVRGFLGGGGVSYGSGSDHGDTNYSGQSHHGDRGY